jgi:uracil-DNA glycosylase
MNPLILKNAKILLIGDFPNDSDIRAGRPFSGRVGEQLGHMLSDAGLSYASVSLTNVFDTMPKGGDINNWAIDRKSLKNLLETGARWSPIPCKKGVVSPEFVVPALSRLEGEIAKASPNVIVPLGNIALAALTGQSGITKLRGALYMAEGRKVIPSYHPAAIIRNYEWHATAVADFMKVKLHSVSPEAWPKNRKIYLEPTVEDLLTWQERLCRAEFLAMDIETKHRQITCIGFSPSNAESYVIPFWNKKGNHWEDPKDEALAYRVTRAICRSPAVKILQNGLYDLQYLAKYSIPVQGFSEDTMIKHHALYPALPKGLDYLGSLYTDEVAWKRWRVRGGDTQELKKDE